MLDSSILSRLGPELSRRLGRALAEPTGTERARRDLQRLLGLAHRVGATSEQVALSVAIVLALSEGAQRREPT